VQLDGGGACGETGEPGAKRNLRNHGAQAGFNPGRAGHLVLVGSVNHSSEISYQQS
jgi:hypothetical protein